MSHISPMSYRDATPSAPKLPMDRAIRRSYAWFFGGFSALLRMTWLCLLSSALLNGAAMWIDSTWPTRGFAAPPPQPTLVVIASYGIDLLLMMAATSIALGGHRRLICNEPPRLSCVNVLTRELWRSMGLLVALAIMVLAPPIGAVVAIAVLMGERLNIHSDSFVLLPLLALAILLTCSAIALRFVLLLPARAVGNNDLTWRQSWSCTRGNAWRLFGGIVACTVPPVVVLELTRFVLGKAYWQAGSPMSVLGLPSEPYIAAVHSAVFAGYMLFMLLSVALLSQAYQHFHTRQESDAQPE
jgi:hypothetical protein